MVLVPPEAGSVCGVVVERVLLGSSAIEGVVTLGLIVVWMSADGVGVVVTVSVSVTGVAGVGVWNMGVGVQIS